MNISSDFAKMVSAYAECALWSSLDWSGMDEEAQAVSEPIPMDDRHSTQDLDITTWQSFRDDCHAFIIANSTDLCALDAEQVGHDFWLTRNGHGAGFWDRGLGDLGERLTAASSAYGTVDLYVGEDGRIYSE